MVRCFLYVKAAGGDSATVAKGAPMQRNIKLTEKHKRVTDGQKKEKDPIVRLKNVVGWD